MSTHIIDISWGLFSTCFENTHHWINFLMLEGKKEMEKVHINGVEWV